MTFTAQNNPANAPRDGRLLVAGTLVPVRQDGLGCTYDVPATVEVPGAGGRHAVLLATEAGCPITATDPDLTDFIDVLEPDQAAQTVPLQVMPNRSSLARTGSVLVSGQTVTVIQLPETFDPSRDQVDYYHTDAIGSVRMITRADGTVTRFDYLPFGEQWQPVQGQRDSRMFAGKERDSQIGLDYFGARYYASRTGRFTTVDPGHVNGDIYDPQSWNAYAYARNNPLKYTDPTGTEYEICAYGSNGMTSSCGSVSDQYFSILERNPGADLRLWGGAIFAGNKVAGYYRHTSVDPTLDDFIGLTGVLSSRWLREQTTEMAIGAAIAATGGLAAGALGGGLAATSILGLEAPSMTELANVMASGARMANFGVNLTAREFQSNLLRSGYRIIRQGVGTNGPFTVLSKGEKTYTIYTASSTGGPAALVRVAGQTVSKIRLSGF